MKLIVNGVVFNDPKEINVRVEADPEGSHVDHVKIVVTRGELLVDEGVILKMDVDNGGRLSICKSNALATPIVVSGLAHPRGWEEMRMLDADEQQIVDMGR